MSKIGLGVKVFSRADKLSDLLESVTGTLIDEVYIADDGKSSEEKRKLYESKYPFELTVIDLEYDAGLGYGRNRIVEASDEEYMFIVDSDHEIPKNANILIEQLEEKPDIGGISGLLFERGKIRGTCHDIFEDDDILVRDIRTDKTVHRVAEAPLIKFDFIPNAAVFRRECLEEVAWDPEYVIGKEHLDFYVTHRWESDWKFAVNPTVLFNHYPGGGAGYVADRESAEKLKHSKQYFLQKWGYSQLILGQTDWIDASRRQRDWARLVEGSIKNVLFSLPSPIQAQIMDLRDKIRERRNRPPL